MLLLLLLLQLAVLSVWMRVLMCAHARACITAPRRVLAAVASLLQADGTSAST